jgi:putative SOS response-associated peptidase YedK
VRPLRQPRESYRQLFRPKRLPQSNFPPRYNIAPTDPIPIVRIDPRDDERELIMARWELVPWFSKTMPKIPHINARAETVHEKAPTHALGPSASAVGRSAASSKFA